MTERVSTSLALESKLRRAVENEEFILHYQPKVSLETRAIVGVEALIRWQTPDRGLVPPAQFIPLLEETGLILQVGGWALRRAALDHRAWSESGLKAPRVAVNVSAIQLRQRDFVAIVEQAILDGLAPTAIDLELTESLVMADVRDNIEKLKAVRALGVEIAIDDFGTGYSSLGYLAQLPVQSLKIDRSFIVRMQEEANAMTLVSTMISLARSLGLKVVAEGVETEDQAKFLRLLRCDQMQGYLFSKPVPAAELVRLLPPLKGS
jgi:EAL domain-containing protein (putative c-di-GMP-specific phosphodiesterase class I)